MNPLGQWGDDFSGYPGKAGGDNLLVFGQQRAAALAGFENAAAHRRQRGGREPLAAEAAQGGRFKQFDDRCARQIDRVAHAVKALPHFGNNVGAEGQRHAFFQYRRGAFGAAPGVVQHGAHGVEFGAHKGQFVGRHLPFDHGLGERPKGFERAAQTRPRLDSQRMQAGV